LRAAKAWGLSPSQWRAESVDDRALMLAYVLFEGTLEARRQAWREERRERETRRDGEHGTFSAMKNRLKGSRT
jgi:hypothetical protein